MNEEIFAKMAEQMHPDPEVLANLQAQLEVDQPSQASASDTAAGRGKRAPGRWLAAAAAAAVAAALVVPALNVGGSAQPAGSTVEADGSTVTNVDYAMLYRAVSTAAAKVATSTTYDRTRQGAPVPGPVADTAGGKAESSSTSWQTNVQVQGIDEGDIVKSDGRSLFVASGKQVAILAAAGERTKELARIDTAKGAAGQPSGDKYTVQGPVVDLVLSGSTLAVLVTEYQPRTADLPGNLPGPAQETTMVPFDAKLTKALLYDVSDPAAPRYLSSLGQSGALVTTRLADGLLYVVTEYTITDQDAVKPDDPQTFVPVLTKDGKVAATKAGDCGIMPAPSGPSYAVVSSIDLGSRSRVDSKSVLGGSTNVYMSNANLYLAATQWDASAAEVAKAAGSKDLSQAQITHLARISIEAGKLNLAAQGSVLGTVLNQFTLDEYEGNLRVVTTVEGQGKGGGWAQRAALYVLDPKLKVIGSISSLVNGESLQSVRFAGAVGYVVTFKQVDPLFAIDLSNAQKPRVLSALKIPGFSTYLHPWSAEELLGLGRYVTTKGEDRGLKLSMFDTSDPLKVTESTSLRISADDSEALVEHKAVLVDTAAGLIGLPTSTWAADKVQSAYQVFGYDPKGGFKLVKKLSLASRADGQVDSVRGLLIADHLYVASAGVVHSYRTSDFASVAKVSLKG